METVEERTIDRLVHSLEIQHMRNSGEYIKEWWVEESLKNPPKYSTDWMLAGPIIQREGISVTFRYDRPELWGAVIKPEGWVTGRSGSGVKKETIASGETALQAAMLCYVNSRGHT